MLYKNFTDVLEKSASYGAMPPYGYHQPQQQQPQKTVSGTALKTLGTVTAVGAAVHGARKARTWAGPAYTKAKENVGAAMKTVKPHISSGVKQLGGLGKDIITATRNKINKKP